MRLVLVRINFFDCMLLARSDAPHKRAAGNFYDEILARMAVHPLAHAPLADFGDEPRHVVLRDEIVEVVVRLQNHAPSASPVAAARTTLGNVRFAMERDGAFAAVSRPRVNFDFVDEHSVSFLILFFLSLNPGFTNDF
jgi:hypothetical protein